VVEREVGDCGCLKPKKQNQHYKRLDMGGLVFLVDLSRIIAVITTFLFRERTVDFNRQIAFLNS
jgi:hypothetical protein